MNVWEIILDIYLSLHELCNMARLGGDRGLITKETQGKLRIPEFSWRIYIPLNDLFGFYAYVWFCMLLVEMLTSYF